MTAKERHNFILRSLADKSTIKISELMQHCNVSHETARHDLETLQEQGLIRRIHGGAVLAQQDTPSHIEIPGKRSPQFDLANLSVAKTAALLAGAGDTAFLDAGRTIFHLAHNLRDLPDLFVVTPSLLVINELQNSNIRLHSLAGELDHAEYCFTGEITQLTFSSFNVDISFISCTSLDPTHGSFSDQGDTGLPRTLIRKHTNRLVLLVNSENLHTRIGSRQWPLSLVDTIVVDERISREDEEILRKTGAEMIIAPMLNELPDGLRD